MSYEQLRERLAALQGELEAMEQESPVLDERMQVLVSELERQLDAPVVDGEATGLAEQFDEAVTQFETEHPTLTAILADISVKLTSMGI